MIVDMEPFHKWPKNRRPKEVAWIILTQEDPPKQTGSPAPHDTSDDSDRDSRRNSLASSWASSPARSVGSTAGSVASDLLLSSSSQSGSGSDIPSLSRDPSDDDSDQASDNNPAGPSGGEEGGVITRITLVQVRSVNPTTREMQATGSLKTALPTLMTSLVMTARVLQKQHNIWRQFTAGYWGPCTRRQRLCAPVM